MKGYSLIVIFVCCICKYTSVDIMPSLKRNFGYRINFKYGGMLSHSFDRFYVVTKFGLQFYQPWNILKCLQIKFDSSCTYFNVDLNWHQFPTQYIPNIKNFYKKIIPFIDYYEKQIDYYNCTAQNILTNEISLILPSFQRQKREV